MTTEFEFVEPSYTDFLRSKFLSIPTWDEAYAWGTYRLGGEPMTQEEYQRFLDIMPEDPVWAKKNADSINRSRSRTIVGWYIWGWYKYWRRIFTYTYKQHSDACYDEAIERYAQRREDEREFENRYSRDYY